MANYNKLREILSDADIRNKCEAAAMVAAHTINAENVATANHTNRLKWAKAVFLDSARWGEIAFKIVVINQRASTEAQIRASSDTEIQTAVDALVNLFADGV